MRETLGKPTLRADELQAALDRLPRVRLATLPTPLEECARLSAAIGGPRVIVKRDDLTGLALGGNKVRHLEYRLASARDRGDNVIVMAREPYSNNARQTAAAAAKLGMKMVLVVFSHQPPALQGNLLLDKVLGAEIEYVQTTATAIGELRDHVRQVADRLRQQGHQPFLNDEECPERTAAFSYVNAALELHRQLEATNVRPDAVYMVSGNSQVGLQVGLRVLGYDIPIVGIGIEPGRLYADRPHMAEIAMDVVPWLGSTLSFTANDIEIHDEWMGPGYGVPTESGKEAIELAARTEGLIVDPVYTGKALAGMIAQLGAGRFRKDQTVVFIHTGGVPILFSYSHLWDRGYGTDHG